MSGKTKLFTYCVAVLGLVQLVCLAPGFEITDQTRFFTYLSLAVLCSLLHARRPFFKLAFSASLPFLLLSIVELSPSETVAIGCAAALGQSLWCPRTRSSPGRVLLDLGILATIIAMAELTCRVLLPASLDNPAPRILVAAVALFVANTFPAAMEARLAGEKRMGVVWRELCLWTFPYYLVAAGAAAVLTVARSDLDWQTTLLILPAFYLAYRYYHVQRMRLQQEETHNEQIASLQRRTVECLAMAVESRESRQMRGHLRRVELYAVELGKELGLAGEQLTALETAAVLHDIGKLAVPERILAKPGKLTSQESARLTLHPLVGADIVEQIQFPYPVAPLIRAHHERWNGSGYPHGLRAAEIPLGARVLAVADTLDALTSDREYRRAISFEEAVRRIEAEAGHSYDPAVVKALRRRISSIEDLVKLRPEGFPMLVASAAGAGAHAPAASGLDSCEACLPAPSAHASGASETDLPALLLRLHSLVPHDAVAVFILRASLLTVRYAAGVNRSSLASLEVPVGEGMVGWVAGYGLPLVNGNPAVEPGYAGHPGDALEAALAVPLVGPQGLLGVLACYRRTRGSFTARDLGKLRDFSPRLCVALAAESGRRAFFETLRTELAMARRRNRSVGVLCSRLEGCRDRNGRCEPERRELLPEAVVQALRQGCRASDHVLRIADSELAMVLPGMSRHFLDQKAAMLSSAVSEAARRFSEGDLAVFIGGSSYPDDVDSPKHLLLIAERRMKRCEELQPSLASLNHLVGPASACPSLAPLTSR
jgi:putative nucleotidyltransferase with HDIG domain